MARAFLGALVAMLLAGCAALLGSGPQQVAAPALAPLGDTQCVAESYDFVGEGTLRGLGLEGMVPAPLPTPDRPAMIWVTHDLLPHDLGEPGGPVEMTRILCFEFADGSGGSGWPVDPEWQPPANAASSDAQGIALPSTLLLLGLVVLLAIGISVLAFRRRG